MAPPPAVLAPQAGPWAQALARDAVRRVQAEWFGSPPHLLILGNPRARGFAAAPHDLRPASPAVGEAILEGVFALAGESLDTGPGGDPWNRASPSRRFAVELHQFGWMGDLIAAGDAGVAEALRLTEGWRRVFGRWNSFAWTGEVLERRVFNLACAARRIAAAEPEADGLALADSLGRQARHLLVLTKEPNRAAARLTAVAAAGAALAGQAGDRLMDRALAGLEPTLERTVLADGTHASRSPEAGMELLFDLLALDDGLGQRGRPPPEALSRAVERLTAGLRFFTLPDGRVACFQGGEESDPWRVAAARAQDDVAAEPPHEALHGGYQRLVGPGMVVMADAGPPATGGWSLSACGQPLAIEVICDRDRLITNTGWSERAGASAAFRLTAAGSTATIGRTSLGAPLSGFRARALGARLIGGIGVVSVARRENDAGVWVELTHSGWLKQTGLTHERRLFLDKQARELRGEDRFVPSGRNDRMFTPVEIYFHLHPDVRASLARDQRSVLLKGPSEVGWWLRNDAGEVAVEPSVHFIDGQPRQATRVVMRGRLRADRGGRVRWKLSAAEAAPAPVDSPDPGS
jgi:uncharacterized heparinase superfamily protein